MNEDVFFSDLEGPWVLNDFAFEVLDNFLDDGEKIYKVLSAYDDYLAFSIRREGYEPGYTLKLIVPFMLAHDLRDEDLEHLARKIIKPVPDAEEALRSLADDGIAPIIITTSYSQFAKTCAEILDIDPENVYSTELSLDVLSDLMTRELREEVLRIESEIAELWDELGGVSGMENLDERAINMLEDFFWRGPVSKDLWRIMGEVEPLGGIRKWEIVERTALRLDIDWNVLLYIGDSISDMIALEKIEERGGVAASFNGNRFAIEKSNLAIVANTALGNALAASLTLGGRRDTLFGINGRVGEAELEMIEDELTDSVRLSLRRSVRNRIIEVFNLRRTDRARVLRRSMEMRIFLRGASIGELG